MLPDKQSGKKPFVLDNYLFAPDNVRDRPLIFRLETGTTKVVTSARQISLDLLNRS
jgi:hypothetical protein